MLRDERLQKVVTDIDAAPDRERVSREDEGGLVHKLWRTAGAVPEDTLPGRWRCAVLPLLVCHRTPPEPCCHAGCHPMLSRRCCARCRRPTSRSLRTRQAVRGRAMRGVGPLSSCTWWKLWQAC